MDNHSVTMPAMQLTYGKVQSPEFWAAYLGDSYPVLTQCHPTKRNPNPKNSLAARLDKNPT